jgi:CubicO group peptidase (beta-lactamase class C family)
MKLKRFHFFGVGLVIFETLLILSLIFTCSCSSNNLYSSNQLQSVSANRDSSDTKAFLKSTIEKFIKPIISSKKAVGLSVGIISGGQKAVFGYGKVRSDSNEVPNGNTIYEIGSITKVFTALLLADMADRGKIDFNDPIEKFLPAEVNAPDRNIKHITLINLATHTSGLPRLPSNLNVLANMDNPYSTYSNKELYKFLCHYTLAGEPGVKYEYSNLGVGLLGHILDLAERKPYEDLVVNYICKPLGMNDTRITLSEEQKKRFSKGYTRIGFWPVCVFLPAGNWDFLALSGCGALRSTANDMMKILSANMGINETKLSKVMQKTHKARSKINENMSIAMGWHIMHFDDKDGDIIWHNGGTGGYRSFIGFDKVNQVGVVILCNTSTDEIDKAGFDILFELMPSNHR